MQWGSGRASGKGAQDRMRANDAAVMADAEEERRMEEEAARRTEEERTEEERSIKEGVKLLLQLSAADVLVVPCASDAALARSSCSRPHTHTHTHTHAHMHACMYACMGR